jgi:single-stranded-DNA-specific exonuclease
MVTKPKIVTRDVCIEDRLPMDMHPVLKKIYLARSVSELRQTENTLQHLLPFEDLRGVDQAAQILAEHIKSGKKILIVGDYDADGATSCALAIRALRAMGAEQVDYLVPNRFEYGYGLTPEIVMVARQKSPDLIVTVDNGIASIEGVNSARKVGISVIITDHHLPGEVLPEADAIVNPNQPDDQFPSKNLAGVGVIFYLMAALRSLLRDENWFAVKGIAEPNLADYLDLVALGTVADVVKLDHNNRILVAQGLARIRAGKSCPGIRALLRVSGRDEKNVTSTDLGFCVGPRLNAAGRLDDMSIGINCLLSDDEQRASEVARKLDRFNSERRQIEQDMREQASSQLEKILAESRGNLPSTISLYQEDFHEGVIGILAGRIKEQLHRPTLVFARSSDGMLKGSARSIPGLHMRDALDTIATRHPGLLEKFGGHAMAAGLSLKEKDFAEFSEKFNNLVETLLDDDSLQQTIHCDGTLQDDDLNLDMAELLRNAGPWGQGFPEPQFEGRFEVINKRIVGEHHLKMLLKSGKQHIDAIAFRTTDYGWPEDVNCVELVYRLDVNEFNGQRNAQLIVEHLKPV